MYDTFFTRTKRTVYKWWCLVYKPVYVLIHHDWPAEKDPDVRYPVSKSEPDVRTDTGTSAKPEAILPADTVAAKPETILRADTVAAKPETILPADTVAAKPETILPADTGAANPVGISPSDEIPADVDADVLARANEIMARLNREAAEDEAKKNHEIELAKQQAAEQERLAAILKANERNIDAFIQEGLSLQHSTDT